MVTVELTGRVIKIGTSKKGNKYINVLTERPDKSAYDVVTVLTNGKRTYKLNEEVKILGSVSFVRVITEV